MTDRPPSAGRPSAPVHDVADDERETPASPRRLEQTIRRERRIPRTVGGDGHHAHDHRPAVGAEPDILIALGTRCRRPVASRIVVAGPDGTRRTNPRPRRRARTVMRFSYAEAMVDPSFYAPLASAAEAAGFDSFLLPESIVYPQHSATSYPYVEGGGREFLEDKPFIDPFVLAARWQA